MYNNLPSCYHQLFPLIKKNESDTEIYIEFHLRLWPFVFHIIFLQFNQWHFVPQNIFVSDISITKLILSILKLQ